MAASIARRAPSEAEALLLCAREPLSPTPFLGGFECSCQRLPDGRRLDLLAATAHDRHADSDYRRLLDAGLGAVRDGLRWHLIETAPGRYDWSSASRMVEAARRSGMRVVWDLCHYGWPDGLDIWSEDFGPRFAAFAAAAAERVAADSEDPPAFCTVNEISFLAWAGGEVGRFFPAAEGRGDALKRQLVRAAIGAAAAIRSVVPEARFLHAEPAIHIDPGLAAPEEAARAEAHRSAQFEALDMIAGVVAPELGGRPDLLDVVGVNFYPDNQWYAGGRTIPLGHHAYRPLRFILAEIAARYGRPLLVSETGAEGTAKPAWLAYVAAEVRAAQRAGVPVEGICLYPILDYPGWDDGRACAVGLLSQADAQGRRALDTDFADEVARQTALAAAKGTPMAGRPPEAL